MTAAPESRGDLPEARRHLDNAISALIDPKPVTIHRDNGTTQITWTDSLYDQLSDAVSGQTGERSGRATSSPLWTDALDLRRRIHHKAAEWHPQPPPPDETGDTVADTQHVTIARLRAIQARKWRPQDVPLICQITGTLEGFVEKIRTLLDGDRIKYLYAPDHKGLVACPACNLATVKRWDAAAQQTVNQPTMQIHRDGSTNCANKDCRASWGPERAMWLGHVLGYQLPAGMLE